MSVGTAVFLELNGAGVASAPDEDVYRLVMQVASVPLDVEETARGLRSMHGR